MKKKVLVIDDEYSMLKIISTVLEGENFVVVTVNSVKDALDKIATETFNLIITDILMPGRIGIKTLFNKVNSLSQKLPIIVISAYWDETEEMIDFIKSNATAYLSKPFDINEFRKIVREMQ